VPDLSAAILVEHFHRHAAVRVLDDLDRMILSRVMQETDYVYHLAAFVGAPQSVLQPHTCVN
jgi:nucleoside-diphosphate-sugar epimerase